MAFEHWYCEKCSCESTVQNKRTDTVHEVRDAIAAQHRRIAPKCHGINSLDGIRVGFRPKTNPNFEGEKR